MLSQKVASFRNAKQNFVARDIFSPYEWSSEDGWEHWTGGMLKYIDFILAITNNLLCQTHVPPSKQDYCSLSRPVVHDYSYPDRRDILFLRDLPEPQESGVVVTLTLHKPQPLAGRVSRGGRDNYPFIYLQTMSSSCLQRRGDSTRNEKSFYYSRGKFWVLLLLEDIFEKGAI